MEERNILEEDDEPVITEVPGSVEGKTRFNSARGFIYHKKRFNDDYRDLVCIKNQKKKGGCNSKVHMDLIAGVSSSNGIPHNIPPEFEEQLRCRAMAELIQETKDTRERTQFAFDRVRRRIPGVRIRLNEAVKRKVSRKRQKKITIPKTFEESVQLLLQHPAESEAFRGGNMFIGEAVAGDGKALVFISPNLLGELGEVDELQADGTFWSVPKPFKKPHPFKQLFSLHLTRFGRAYPVMFALMTHKTEELYDAALAKLLGAYTDRFPDKPIRIVNAMWDYEKAIQNALRTAFPGCDVHGCNFHYGQAIWRKCQDVGLTVAYRTPGVVKRVVKELIALSLLPGDHIPSGLQNIVSHYKDILRGETQVIQDLVDDLYGYFQRTWMRGYSPEVFNVCELLHRTNNLVEAWHHWFKQRCLKAHPSFWDFLEFLRDAENSKEMDYETDASLGPNFVHDKPADQAARDREISELQQGFKNGTVTIRQFLERASYKNEPDLDCRNRDVDPETIPRQQQAQAARRLRGRYPAGTVRLPALRPTLNASDGEDATDGEDASESEESEDGGAVEQAEEALFLDQDIPIEELPHPLSEDEAVWEEAVAAVEAELSMDHRRSQRRRATPAFIRDNYALQPQVRRTRRS